MIHIITSENRHLYGPQLRAMREQRVETNGWVDPAALDGGEIDDQDDARATPKAPFGCTRPSVRRPVASVSALGSVAGTL